MQFAEQHPKGSEDMTHKRFSVCQGQTKVVVLLASWGFQENKFQNEEGYMGGFEIQIGRKNALIKIESCK